MAAPFFNQLDQNTLAAQYDQIRKTQGSGSARSLRDTLRQGGFGDETNQDQSSGIRRAGWKDSAVAPESMPEVDVESKSLLGNRIGEYVTGGGNKTFGYYGDVDVYDRQKLDPWLSQSGFSYAKGPEDAEYVKAGLDLPSLWKNPLFKTGEYDWTQKYGYNQGNVYNKGVNDYMASLGYTHDLGNTFDLQATTQLPGLSDNFTKLKDYYGKSSINDYLSRIGYSDVTNSEWKDYLDLVQGQNYAKTGGKDYWSGDVNKFGYGATNDLYAEIDKLYNQNYRNQYETIGIPNTVTRITSDAWDQQAALYNPSLANLFWENQDKAVYNNGAWEIPNNDASVRYKYQGYDYKDEAALRAAQDSELAYLKSNPMVARNAYLNMVHGRALGENQGLIGHTSVYVPPSGQMPMFLGNDQAVYDTPFSGWTTGYSNPNLSGQTNDGSFSDLVTRQRLSNIQPEDALKHKVGNIFQGDVTDSGLLKTLFGGQDVLYGNQDIGDRFNDPGETLLQNTWDDSWSRTDKNLIRKKEVGENKGGSNYLTSAQDLGFKKDNGYFAPTDYKQLARFAGDDQRYNESFSNTSLRGVGKLIGAALNFIPFVGPAASAVFTGANNKGSWSDNLTGESKKWGGVSPGAVLAGAVSGGLGGIPGLNETIGTGLGLGGELGKYAGNAVLNAGTNTLGGLASGKGLTDSLKGGLVSGAGSFAGNALSGQLGSLFSNSELGGRLANSAIKGGVGSLASNTTKALLSGNKPTQDMLLASLVSAAGGAGGTGLGSAFANNKQEYQNYQRLGNTLANLGIGYNSSREKQKILNQRTQQQNQQRQQQISKLEQRLRARV
jgi:hypothetical protein